MKDHAHNESRKPLLPPHGLLFPISSKRSLCAPHHRLDSTYPGLGLHPAVEHWLNKVYLNGLIKEEFTHTGFVNVYTILCIFSNYEMRNNAIGDLS